MKKLNRIWLHIFLCYLLLFSVLLSACNGASNDGTNDGGKEGYAIYLNRSEVSIEEGSEITLKAEVEKEGNLVENCVVLWSCSDTSYATISNGIVKGIKPGKVTITAEYKGQIASCIINITKYYPTQATVVLNCTDILLNEIGQSIELFAEVKRGGEKLDNPPISFVTSNSSVVTVTSQGLVTVVGVGDALVSVVYEENGLFSSAVCKVQVSLFAEKEFVSFDTEYNVFPNDIARTQGIGFVGDILAVRSESSGKLLNYQAIDGKVYITDNRLTGQQKVSVETSAQGIIVRCNFISDTISTVDEFLEKTRANSEGYFVLNNDIDFTGYDLWVYSNWDYRSYLFANFTGLNPCDQNPFRGVLDGQGYTLKGITSSDAYYTGGIFGQIDGTFKNLRVKANLFFRDNVHDDGWYQKKSNYVVAKALNGTLENCIFDVTLTWMSNGTENSGYFWNIGESAIVRNCIFITRTATEAEHTYSPNKLATASVAAPTTAKFENVAYIRYGARTWYDTFAMNDWSSNPTFENIYLYDSIEEAIVGGGNSKKLIDNHKNATLSTSTEKQAVWEENEQALEKIFTDFKVEDGVIILKK